LTLPIALACALVASVAHAQSAGQGVDFEREVLPILKAHCWRCHGAEQASGGLRLDERQLAARGGGSGRNVLVNSPRTNELLRRVRSTVEGERMPLEGAPLSEEQIATLEQWLSQGAPWTLPQPSTVPAIRGEPPPGLLVVLLDRWEYLARPVFRPAHWLMVAVLVAILFVEHSKGLLKKAEQAAGPTSAPRVVRALASCSRAWYLVGILAASLVLTLLCWREDIADLTPQTTARASGARAGQVTATTDRSQLHEPLRPRHPPRLGGYYYRGNDERSEELFNGGFYRTATFHVHLADTEGNKIGWDEPVPDPAFIRLEIERSPHSSPHLFNEESMVRVGLSDVQPEQVGTLAELPFVRLTTLEAGNRWSVLYPLAEIPAHGKLTGKLYLYRGSSENEAPLLSEPSYLIGYELSATEGLVSRESQIWMASVYNVLSLQWPEPSKIQPDHWFDFRPIPEIVK
jgi:cytochrome c553